MLPLSKVWHVAGTFREIMPEMLKELYMPFSVYDLPIARVSILQVEILNNIVNVSPNNRIER